MEDDTDSPSRYLEPHLEHPIAKSFVHTCKENLQLLFYCYMLTVHQTTKVTQLLQEEPELLLIDTQ